VLAATSSSIPLGALSTPLPIILLTLPLLLIVWLLMLHGPLGFGDTLCEYPSLSSSRSIRQCFMLCFHAGSLIGVQVGLSTFDLWHVVALDAIWALMPFMVHIITACEAIEQVQKPFLSVAVGSILVV
jgi:hypothetical protein